jgi:hypothetical protein
MSEEFIIAITPPQAMLLSQAYTARESIKEQFAMRIQRAEEDLNLVASAITAGHGAGPYEVVAMDLTSDPPSLTLRMPNGEGEGAEKMGITASPDGLEDGAGRRDLSERGE